MCERHISLQGYVYVFLYVVEDFLPLRKYYGLRILEVYHLNAIVAVVSFSVRIRIVVDLFIEECVFLDHSCSLAKGRIRTSHTFMNINFSDREVIVPVNLGWQLEFRIGHFIVDSVFESEF